MTDDRTATADRTDRTDRALTQRRRLLVLYTVLLVVDVVALVRRVHGYRLALAARPHRSSR